MVLHLSSENIAALIKSPKHEERVVGVAFTPDLNERRWTVTDGTLNVLIDDPRFVDTKLLVYRLTLTAANGDKLWLRGHKVVSPDTLRRGLWRALTRVPFVVYDQEPDEVDDQQPDEATTGPDLGVCKDVETWDQRGQLVPHAIGAGVLSSTVADALRLALSMTIVREPRMWNRLRWRLRFTWGLFVRTIIELRFSLLRPTRGISPFERQSLVAVSRPTTDVTLDDTNHALPRFLLTHYRAKECDADRKPVILAPGFGMSADAFRVGNPSIAEYLHSRNYDVWFLDYRGSDKLEISLTQFDVDDLAGDFAEAIGTLHALYNRKHRVRVVAHCVASLAMQMALLKGGLREKGLHSVVLSQSFAFIDSTWSNRLKAVLRLPDVLSFLNFGPVLSSDYDRRSSYRTRALDRLLHFYPSAERCGEGVCRRLLLLYGEVIRHDQLDLATHQSLYDMFDRANLTTFKHLAKMFACGHIVDHNGRNEYLTARGRTTDRRTDYADAGGRQRVVQAERRRAHARMVRDERPLRARATKRTSCCRWCPDTATSIISSAGARHSTCFPSSRARSTGWNRW